MLTLPGVDADTNQCVILGPSPSIRCPGSAAVNMCLVACGSADAYYHMGIHCWDMAAGAAIVSEAGGVILDVSGEALCPPLSCVTSRLCCSNFEGKLLKHVADALGGRENVERIVAALRTETLISR